MASVYRATHVALDQPVALKIVSPLMREVPGVVPRFLREARAAIKLKSAHVVRVIDVGSMPDGAPYMVMEFLEGQDLDEKLEGGWRPAVDEAVEYILQACEALAEVHGLGIVHRDLKPANLFLTRGTDGLPCIKLIDFGISHIDAPLGPNDVAVLTHPEVIMGSPRYMSPEMMESARNADERSDIWGIGAVLYELLTGRAPYDGASVEAIYAAALLGPPPPPSSLRPDVPTELDEIILRCLAMKPEDRFADVAELAAALAPFAEESVASLRAAGIARVLDATRGQPRISSPSNSRVRRRSSRSIKMKRNRGIVWAVLLVAATLTLVAFGERGLEAISAAMTKAPVESEVRPIPITPPPPPAPAVEPEPTATSEHRGAAHVTTTDAARRRSAPPRPPPAPAPAPPPQSPSTSLPWPGQQPTPQPAPTIDERRLFEDRQ